MQPGEERFFDVIGTIWDYSKIASVSVAIADEFLYGIDTSDLERRIILNRFEKSILETEDGVNRKVQLIGSGSLFDMAFSEGMSIPYLFNKNGEIVDYMGVAVPKDFVWRTDASLEFSQRAHRDKFIKGTPIPKMQAENVMRFVEAVCGKYYGILPLIGPNDAPESIQQQLQYPVISVVQFDAGVYSKGNGPARIILPKYQELA